MGCSLSCADKGKLRKGKLIAAKPFACRKKMTGVGGKVKVVLFLAGVISLAGCGPAASEGLRRVELDCGDGGVVSEVEWESFVEKYITPRFRDGLTIVDASSQWVDKKGEITKERAKIVILFHDGSEEAKRSIEYIRDKYKQLFGQESVLRISMCAEVVY
jgi:uncharacterized lipoprotein YehR (DUF1307 family)